MLEDRGDLEGAQRRLEAALEMDCRVHGGEAAVLVDFDAFARYLHLVNGTFFNYLIIFLFITLLSILSYFYIEKPFRNKNVISLQSLIFSVSAFAILLISRGLSDPRLSAK